MIYVLYGQDDFSLREKVREIQRSMGGEDLLTLNTTTLDGSRLTEEQFMAAATTVPFLAAARLVIIENLLKGFEPRRRDAARQAEEQASPSPSSREPWLEKLGTLLSELPSTTIVVFVDGPLHPPNPLLVLLRGLAKVHVFNPLRGIELQRWVNQRLNRAGAAIAPGAVRRLVEAVGSNLWVLAGEIEKLHLYGQGRRIEEADVELLVPAVREASVFTLIDALMERRPRRAFSLLHRLLEGGARVPYVLLMIGRQVRLVLEAKAMRAAGAKQADIKRELEITADFALERTLEQARTYSWEALERMYHHLLEVDRAIKTGRLEPLVAVDLLVTELSGDLAQTPHVNPSSAPLRSPSPGSRRSPALHRGAPSGDWRVAGGSALPPDRSA